jgi:hypothetical protein
VLNVGQNRWNSMKDRSVLLGSWGIGGSLKPWKSNSVEVAHGPFQGNYFPSTKEQGFSALAQHKWRLPPLARKSKDGIDFMPYILYDKIIIDTLAFECLIGAKPSLQGWRPSKSSVSLLENLASDGYIETKDYLSILDSSENASIVDQVSLLDFTDPNILTPAIESLELWIRFYKDLFGASDESLQNYKRMIEGLKKGKPQKDAFAFMYECVSDINRMLIMSNETNIPIYEWEDYRRYYRYKYLRSAKGHSLRSEGETLGELFNVFMPNFEISDYNQLIDIRNDDRLSSVRSLVDSIGDKPITKDLVVKAHEDVLKMKGRMDTFSKYVGYSGYILSILPGPTGSAIQDVMRYFGKKWIEKDAKWQMFFVERALEYREDRVVENMRAAEVEK